MTVQLFSNGCPVCESKTKNDLHCTMDGYNYICCQNCDLIYQEGSTDISDMTNCYTGGPIKHFRRQLFNRFRKIENQRDFAKRMTRARQIFNFSAKQVSVKKGNYLDIGCNKGFNIYAAEEQGWTGYGNELIAEILVPIKNSKPELKNRLRVGSFVDLGKEYESNFFDLITCIDVIEHLVEPKKAMEDMIRILKPQGAVVYQTVDATKENKALSANWGALKPNEHLLLFNQENFKTMALNAGFKKVVFADEPFEVCDGNFVATCWIA